MSDSPSSLARDFSPGHVLFREGDGGTEMYVIQRGKVIIEKRLGGQERTVAELSEGDFFGEMAVLNERPRTATARCKEATSCLVIDKRTLEAMLAKNPDLAMRLVHRLARRLDGADTMVEILMHPDPRARVLLGLKARIDIADKTPMDTLATEVGATLEQVEAVASRLKRLRLAAIADDGTLTVLDCPRFFEFLEFIEAPQRRGEAG